MNNRLKELAAKLVGEWRYKPSMDVALFYRREKSDGAYIKGHLTPDEFMEMVNLITAPEEQPAPFAPVFKWTTLVSGVSADVIMRLDLPPIGSVILCQMGAWVEVNAPWGRTWHKTLDEAQAATEAQIIDLIRGIMLQSS